MYNLTQQKVLAITPHLTGPLSFLGSCSILYDIFIDRKRKLKRPYYRILLGMSIYDASTSFCLAMSTWPIPRGTAGVWGATGNTQTCTAQGFFNQLMLGSPFYNLMLATYYLLLGRYQLSEEQIAERYEVWMHAFAIIPSVGFALAGLPLTLYNNAQLWCWIASYPSGSEGFNGGHNNIECTRGHGAWLYRWLFFYGPLWFVIVAITVIMILLIKSIRAEEKCFIQLVQRHRCSNSPGHGSVEGGSATVGSEERVECDNDECGMRPKAFHLERSQKMFTQALFYVGAFYITWWAPTINRMVQLIGGESYFFFMFTTTLLAPLQGFFNFLVYRHGPCVA